MANGLFIKINETFACLARTIRAKVGGNLGNTGDALALNGQAELTVRHDIRAIRNNLGKLLN